MDDNLITPSDFFHRGLESLESGRYSEAVEYFEAAVQRSYYEDDIHMPMGEALFEIGRYQDALDQFNKASGADIPQTELLVWKGWCYLELGKVRRALSAFNRVIELQPDHAEAHFKRGLALAESGTPDRALEAFADAERLLRAKDADAEPEALAEVLMWKGRVLSRLGRRAEGMELLFEAFELAPNHPGPYNEIADSYRYSGDMASAEQWYRKGLDRLPEDPSLHNDYGNLLRETGRFRESLQHLTAAIERDAQRAVAYYNRALTLERLELFDEALKDYDAVIDANPIDLDAKLRKLDLLAQMGMFVESASLLANLTEAERATPEVRDAGARLACRRALRAEIDGNLAEALQYHHDALRAHPDFLDVETPAVGDDAVDDRVARLLKLLDTYPAGGKQAGLVALLGGAARLMRLRLKRARGGDAAEVRLRNDIRDCLNTAIQAGTEAGAEGAALAAAAHKLMAEYSFYELKDDDAALKHADAALSLQSDYVTALWIKAITLADGKMRPDLAVECYRRMLAIAPQNPSVMLQLGDLYLDHGQPHRALSYYRRVLEDRPGDVPVNRDIGHCYLALQRFGDAIACFSRLEAQGGMQLEVRLDLAEAHIAVGERTEAQKLVDQVQEENQGLDHNIEARATELSAALANARRKPRAARKLIRSIDDAHVTTFGLLQLAKAEIALEEFDQAFEVLQEVVDTLDPHAGDAIEARYQLSRVEFARGKRDEALAQLDKMLAAAPLDERAYKLKSYMLMLNGELEQADEITDAGKFAQQVARVHRLLQYEEFQEAVTGAEQLAQDYPTRVEPLYYRACGLAQMGHDEQALEGVRAALKIAPELRPRMLEEFYLEPLRLGDRHEFRA